MFIKIKFSINTHTKNIYFWYKRYVHTPSEIWTSVLSRPPGSIIPWNLSAVAFTANHLTITWDPFSSCARSCLHGRQCCCYHRWLYRSPLDTKWNISSRKIQSQRTKYRSLMNTFKQFRSLIRGVSQFNPLFAATQICY